MNCTGTALCHAAAKFSAGHIGHIVEIPKQWHFRIAVELACCSVDFQLDHSRPDGYFDGVPATVTELAAAVAGAGKGRSSPEARVVCINMGIALEDVAAAVVVFQRARERGIGVELPI